jgi:NTP pyrophosphatase (non-canonical NTP hydrolase)
MNIEELQKFIDNEMKRLEEFFGKTNEELKILSAVKLSEEVGELQEEVLGTLKLHRKEKDGRFTKETFGNEFADVIITACILARRHDIDIDEALNRKIKKIKERVYVK